MLVGAITCAAQSRTIDSNMTRKWTGVSVAQSAGVSGRSVGKCFTGKIRELRVYRLVSGASKPGDSVREKAIASTQNAAFAACSACSAMLQLTCPCQDPPKCYLCLCPRTSVSSRYVGAQCPPCIHQKRDSAVLQPAFLSILWIATGNVGFSVSGRMLLRS